jgi:hypothetical protein
MGVFFGAAYSDTPNQIIAARIGGISPDVLEFKCLFNQIAE